MSLDSDFILMKKANLEPQAILDIKKTEHGFIFVIKFCNALEESEKQHLHIKNLNILSDKFKLWILAKYKKNLSELVNIKVSHQWAN